MTRWMALALLLAACSATPNTGPVVAGSLAVGVKKATADGAEPLLIGSSWKLGDQYYLELTSEVDAYVYAVVLMESGAQKVIAPSQEGETLQVRKGEVLRMPVQGWAAVEGNCPGTDRVFIVASQQPLTLVNTVLYNAIDRMRRFEVPAKNCGPEPDPAPEPVASEPVARDPLNAGEGGGAPSVPGLEPLPPPPPPPDSGGAELEADLALFAGRAVCAGREECVGSRELKSQGPSYVAPYDEQGLVVVELPFQHE